VHNTQGLGKEVYAMDREQFSGMMELGMKESGLSTKLADTVNSSMSMETLMTVSG
jgi:hypothetical protein